MYIILILLILSTVCGYVLSGIKNFNRITDKTTLYIIYLLLFFMGLAVGSNPEVMENLPGTVRKALLISLFTITGSILVSWIFYRLIFKKHEK